MVVATLPVGFLYILAFGSLGVYGIVLAGWTSTNTCSLLGGMRASAQMISYEIAMGMTTVAVLLLVGNVSLTDVIAKQSRSLFTWNVFPLSLAFFIFLVAAFAETNRLPFDLPEAEGELIAGYHTEYSAMKFSMFYIAEYSNMVTASALMTTLFFGGWDVPFTAWDNLPPWTPLKTVVTLGSFALKVIFFLFLFIWVRWTLPRFRYDQLMALGWKVMLPLALAYVTIIATAIWFLHDQLGWMYDSRFALALFGLNVLLAVPLFLGSTAVTSSRARWWRKGDGPDGDRREGDEAVGGRGLLPARHAQGHGAHLEPPVAPQGDDAVPGGEEQQGLDALPALARYAPHAHGRAGACQVRRVRLVSPDLPGELHQARARGGRGG